MPKEINTELTSEQRKVMFEEATEAPGSSKLNFEKREGSYHCFNCDIKLFESASHKGLDGYFQSTVLKGASVNIKWYLVQGNLLDITPLYLPDYYLVMLGSSTNQSSSKGKIYPAKIGSVHLFKSSLLVSQLNKKGVKIGTATSVSKDLWDIAEIYPRQKSCEILVTEEQKELIELFDS